MGFVKEFRDFALKGNVLDLAVGVIIGGAFGGIVNSMIKDVIMPIVGMAGNVNFSDKYIALSDSAKKAVEEFAAKNPGQVLPLAKAQEAGAVLGIGNFITILINFIILAFCIFLVVKAFNTAKKKFEKEQAAPPPAPAAKPAQEVLLEQILGELKRR